ncbi:MAG: hypothetical protein WCC82_11070 [Nitrososphaeraceae archaeon]
MSDKFHVAQADKLRGKDAIYDIHRELSQSDENIINFKISEIYSVPLEEADEIHINYHLDRIGVALKSMVEKRDLPEYELVNRLNIFDVQHYANEVSKGLLLERAAIDFLFRKIIPSEKNLSFYG